MDITMAAQPVPPDGFEHVAKTLAAATSHKCVTISIIMETISMAVVKDRVDVLEWLRATEKKYFQLNESMRGSVFMDATARDSVVVLQWLWEHEMISAENYYPASRSSESLLLVALYNNSLNVLKWFHSQGLVNRSSYRKEHGEILTKLTEAGNVFMLEWLRRQGLVTLENHCDKLSVLQNAAAMGKINVLDWLEKEGYVTTELCRANDSRYPDKAIITNCKALEKAVVNGMYESLVWLEKRGVGTHEDCQTLIFCSPKTINPLVFASKLSQNKYAYTYSGTDYPATFTWVAERINLMSFEKLTGKRQVWYDAWRRKVLLLVLAGRRQKRRQPPPELWEYTEQFC